MPSTDERFDDWKRRPGAATLSPLLESAEARVYRICRRVLRDAHDAEEAKQEVLLEMASGLASVVDAAHFDRWVGRVAFRTAVDRKKMRSRRLAREHEAAGRSSNGGSRDDDLYEGMSGLEEEDRELLIERYFDRRTLREMGHRRGVSAVAVRKRLSNAQNRLKRTLGAGIPIALIAGASVVKAKTAAVVAIVLIPLCLSGVWLAALKDSSRNAQSLSTGSKPGFSMSSPANGQENSQANPSPATEAPASGSIEGDDRDKREAFRRNLRRYKAMHDRCHEAEKELAKSLRSGMDAKEFHEEVQQLQKDLPSLAKELSELTRVFPEECLAYFQELEWSPVKKVVGWFLRPVIDAELEADPATPGPCLKALLELARGDLSGKKYLASYSRDLKVGSLDLARFCLGVIEDPDPGLQWDAAAALGVHGNLGNLGRFFAEHKERLQQLALTGSRDRPACFAFSALAAIGDKDTDDFILNQWMAAQTHDQFYDSIRAVNKIGPRISSQQESAIALTLARFLDLPYNHTTFIGVVRVSLHLSAAACVSTLRRAVLNTPDFEPLIAQGLEGIIRRVQSGEAAEVGSEIDKLGGYDFPMTSYAIRKAGRVETTTHH